VSIVLLKNNSMFLRALIRDDDGNQISEATVTATISTLAGAEIWAGSLDSVDGNSRYNYEVLLPSDLDINIGTKYQAVVSSVRGEYSNSVRVTVFCQRNKE
jgi:hypothetical protein